MVRDGNALLKVAWKDIVKADNLTEVTPPLIYSKRKWQGAIRKLIFRHKNRVGDLRIGPCTYIRFGKEKLYVSLWYVSSR